MAPIINDDRPFYKNFFVTNYRIFSVIPQKFTIRPVPERLDRAVLIYVEGGIDCREQNRPTSSELFSPSLTNYLD